MDDASVFGVSNLDDFELRVGGGDCAGVEDLSAAGGIKRCAVEEHCRARCFDDFVHLGVEVVEERVVIVETVGHGLEIILTADGIGMERRRGLTAIPLLTRVIIYLPAG